MLSVLDHINLQLDKDNSDSKVRSLVNMAVTHITEKPRNSSHCSLLPHKLKQLAPVARAAILLGSMRLPCCPVALRRDPCFMMSVVEHRDKFWLDMPSCHQDNIAIVLQIQEFKSRRTVHAILTQFGNGHEHRRVLQAIMLKGTDSVIGHVFGNMPNALVDPRLLTCGVFMEQLIKVHSDLHVILHDKLNPKLLFDAEILCSAMKTAQNQQFFITHCDVYMDHFAMSEDLSLKEFKWHVNQQNARDRRAIKDTLRWMRYHYYNKDNIDAGAHLILDHD